MKRSAVLLGLLALVPLSAAAQQADVWVTHPDRTRLLSWDGKRAFDSDGSVDANTLIVDENTRYQQIDGFGAALTESAAWLIENKLNQTQRAALMQALFGFNEGNAGISYLRIPLGPSDFSLQHVTFDDSCCDLSDFSIARAREWVIPLAVDARAINSSLKFMATSWSAPAWMKDSKALGSGKLDPAQYELYATYLRRSYDAFKDADVTFDAMTIQNEPQFEPGSYPGMKFEWYDELNFVRYHLAAQMAGTGVKLVSFDHNWDKDWYPKAVMSEGADLYDGSAWHCYGGEPEAMGTMHADYPQENIYLTECSGQHDNGNFASNLAWNMQKMFIGGTRNWARVVLLWNLALDGQGGPHTGGCDNCRGVVSIDQASGVVTFNEEFYAIGHFARFVWPGAERIESSNSGNGNFIGVAFRNSNGKKALVVLNQGSSAGTFRMLEQGKSISVDLPASGVATVFW